MYVNVKCSQVLSLSQISFADISESQVYKNEEKSCITSAGATFEHQSIWKAGDCQSCTCRDGVVTCFSQSCPILECEVIAQRKGQCCAKCIGKLHSYVLVIDVLMSTGRQSNVT